MRKPRATSCPTTTTTTGKHDRQRRCKKLTTKTTTTTTATTSMLLLLLLRYCWNKFIPFRFILLFFIRQLREEMKKKKISLHFFVGRRKAKQLSLVFLRNNCPSSSWSSTAIIDFWVFLSRPVWMDRWSKWSTRRPRSSFHPSIGRPLPLTANCRPADRNNFLSSSHLASGDFDSVRRPINPTMGGRTDEGRFGFGDNSLCSIDYRATTFIRRKVFTCFHSQGNFFDRRRIPPVVVVSP